MGDRPLYRDTTNNRETEMAKFLRHKGNGCVVSFNQAVLEADPENLEVIEASFPPHADDQLTEDERAKRDEALDADLKKLREEQLKPAPSAKKGQEK